MKAKLFFIFLSGVFSLTLWAQEYLGADILYEQGRYQEAVKVCLAELGETPKRIDAYCYIVWSYFALKQYEESYEWAKKGREIAWTDRRMIFAAGESLYFLGRNQEALKYFEDYAVFVTTTYNKDKSYHYMGEIFIRLGEFNNADIAFSTAVHFNSKNAVWWARLGYAREMAGDYTWSLDAYENALQLNPTLSEAKQGKERVSRLLNA